MKQGERLLRLFRKEQKKRGNDGCLCFDCIEDMNNARREFFRTKTKKYCLACLTEKNLSKDLIAADMDECDGCGCIYASEN